LRNDVGAFDADGTMIGVVFETATPFDTPRRMRELVEWLAAARELKRLHPLLIIAVFIVVFLAIHPFQDGNGRLSRVLTTLLLLQAGYAYVPYSSLESVIENSKEGYYLALRQTRTTAISSHPGFTSRFHDDLATPGLRIPLTRDQKIFFQAVEVGRAVIWLHTFGERMADPKK